MSDDEPIPSLAEAMAEIRHPSLLLTINHLTAKALEFLAMSEDEFNRLNEMELEAEVERLRTRGRELEAVIDGMAELNDMLRARVLELEAAAAMQHGTLTTMQSQQQDDGGVRFTWNVPPSTPPMEIP